MTCKLIVFEPKPEVCFPRIFRDVGRRSVPWWEGSIEDVSAEGLRPRQVGAWASVLAVVVASATTRVIAVASPLSWIIMGTPASIESDACVVVTTETLMHRDCGVLPAA